jgi:hypothetical protein
MTRIACRAAEPREGVVTFLRHRAFHPSERSPLERQRDVMREPAAEGGEALMDMGPFYTALCSDDQGTEFGVMARSMD